MKISEHANYLLNEYGRLQFDYAAYCKPDGESLRNEARNNLEDYIAELEAAQRWHVVKECNDVATPIDVALRKRIAELEAAQRWIPVSERLPQIGVRVLFYNNFIKNIHKGWYSGDEWTSDIGIFYNGDKLKRITHWMPLPEPPEVQE